MLGSGHIISLVKPHYELPKEKHAIESVATGLSVDAIEGVMQQVRKNCLALNLEILGETLSPIKGKKSSKKGSGNTEILLLLRTTS